MDEGANRRELWRNQIWQGLNFGSKALFLVVMTPWMLEVWGEVKFGVFAMASSLVVSLNLLDFGVRNLTRIRLVEAGVREDAPREARVLAPGLVAFGLMGLVVLVAAWVVTWVGWTERWFGVEHADAWVLVLTTGLTALFMMTLLLLEPLCAQGKLSEVKAANTVGALLAVPAVGGVLLWGGGVAAGLVAYFAALFGPNVWLLGKLGWHRVGWGEVLGGVKWSEVVGTWKQGGWFYATTVALIAKTHLLTLMVGVVLGPAEAGLFYIALRLTELLSGVAGTSSEPAIAALAERKSPEERRQVFVQAWDFSLVLTLHGFLLLGFWGERLLQIWLGSAWVGVFGIGWGMALFGLGAVVSRMAVNGSMGLGLVRWGAVGSFVEAMVVAAAVVLGTQSGGLGVGFGLAIAGVIPLLPTMGRMAERMGGHPVRLWLGRVGRLLPGLGLNGILLAWGAGWPVWGMVLAGGVAGGVVL
ncbi:MAG: hypothetical protein SNJ84_06160, partial [Verrucomicrobiia bacterium]